MRPQRLPLLIAAACLAGAAGPSPHALLPRVSLASPIVRVDAPFNPAAGDVDFLFRLGMLEGHLIVGHDLLVARQGSLALPHFGHPVRELYDDVSDYLDGKKFPPFDSQLVKLEAAVASAPYAPDTEAKYQAAIAMVHKARDIAPANVRASVPTMIKVCADTLDAASGEYSGALERGRIQSIVEYHDSRGYVSWVSEYLQALFAAHPDPASQDLLGRMKLVLAKAQWIVEPLLPAAAPRASVGQYRAVAAEAAAIAKN